MDRQRQTIELLHLLGNDIAENILAQLPPDQAQKLRIGMTQSPSQVLLRPRQQRQLLDSFDEFFQFALKAGKTRPRLASLSDTSEPSDHRDRSAQATESGESSDRTFELTGDPLTDLQSLSIYQLAQALETEQPRTTAILLSCLAPKLAADALSMMQEEYCRRVVKELSREQHAPQILVERIARATLHRGATLSSDPPDRREHADRLADVLRSVPRQYRMSMLTAIEEQDADLNRALLKKMYRFDDMLALEPRTIQRILGEVDGATLTTALFNASEEIKEAILRNLSRRARQSIEEELQFQTHVPESRVQMARESIAEVIARVDQEME